MQVVHVLANGAVDQRQAFGAQLHQHAAGVGGVDLALDQAAFFQLLQLPGHGAGGEHQRRKQHGGGQAIRFAAAAQGSQQVELPAGQLVAGKDCIQAFLHLNGAASEAAHRAHWRDVKVGAFAPPLLQDGGDRVVGLAHAGSWGGEIILHVR